jgi:hypothetical protein
MSPFLLIILLALCDDDPIFRFVIEVAHHGARSSPVHNFDISPVPWDINHKHGEITNVGLREGYLLGRALREKYMHKADILSEKYDDYQILIKTAPYNAAIMSGIAQMMGFYTPGVGDVLTEMEQGIAIPPVEDPSVLTKEIKTLADAGLPYYTQVLPAHEYEGNQDWVFSTLSQCNVIKYIWANTSATAEYKALEEKYKSLYVSINSFAGTNITNMTTAYLLYDDLMCDLADGKEIADKFKFTSEIIEELRSLANDVWKHLIFGNSTVMKAAVTPLFREWIKLINNVVKDDNEKRPIDKTLNMALYISDASHLLPIMNMLGKSMSAPFQFADNFLLQMGVKLSSVQKSTKNLSDYEFVGFFNGQTIVRNGQLWIDADQFVRMLEANSLLHLTQAQFIDWCNTIPEPPVNPVDPVIPTVPKIWNIIAIIIEVIFLLIIVLTCFFVNRKKVDKPVEPAENESAEKKDIPTNENKESEAKAL